MTQQPDVDAVASEPRLDTIHIRGLELLLFCGVLPEEQQRRQPFLFDVALHLDLSQAGASDDLHHTADYGALIDTLQTTLSQERFQLLERLATRTTELVFDTTEVSEVTVEVQKLRPPVPAHAESTGVELHRVRPR
jgi:dihydroneopterin aldolase/2-amino-4-hydroxy-6-hydroxymethyldihydropteridine diphosphokinase